MRCLSAMGRSYKNSGLTRSKSRSVLVRASAKRSRSSCRTTTSRCATGIFGSLQRDRATHHASTLRCPRSLKGSGFCGFSRLERAPFPGQFCRLDVACIYLIYKESHVHQQRDRWPQLAEFVREDLLLSTSFGVDMQDG